jgi:hypothetical protein
LRPTSLYSDPLVRDRTLESLLCTCPDPLDAIARETARTRSDNDLNPGFDNHPEQRPAAVLAPIIKRASGWTMLSTERAKTR